jgi:hypothetical protein
MTAVSGRLRYAAKAEKIPALDAAVKMDRKAINVEIKAKTDYEQAQKRIVSTSKRFVGVSAATGGTLRVLCNDVQLAEISATSENAEPVYQDVKTVLMNYLDANRERDMKITGVLVF